jgi:LPPG:FO 2-phospho-L-lactate transferase
MTERRHILAFAGGVGGGKFARGLTAVAPPEDLTIVVNTGDDFVHFGLHVSPDVDSVMYAVADLNDPVRGWGLAGETWTFMEALERLGGETWFRLGDRDLATHVLRTQLLAANQTLSEVTARLAQRLGIRHIIAPMSDAPVRTIVQTDEGPLPFQDYFVRRQCAPVFRGIELSGDKTAEPSPSFSRAMHIATTIVITPSNPFISIDPILAVTGIRDALHRRTVPVVAVSPIVGRNAVKGPLAKMMRELDLDVSAASIARHYGDLVDGWIIDAADGADAAAIEAIGPSVRTSATLMQSVEDKARLAREVLDFAAELAKKRTRP